MLSVRPNVPKKDQDAMNSAVKMIVFMGTPTWEIFVLSVGSGSALPS